MVSKSSASNTPKGRESTWNFYLVLNNLILNESATWKLPDSLDDALKAVWTLYDASLYDGNEKARTGEMNKQMKNMDKKINRVYIRHTRGSSKGLLKPSENPLGRANYEQTTANNIITYPWKNALQSPENLNGTVMFNLMHRNRNRRIRATRLEVRVQSGA